jgi:hypothetical protein
LKGFVKDRQRDEAIPFALVVFKVTGQGTLTDASGNFDFNYNKWQYGRYIVRYFFWL